ncbi:MAG: HAMP domain-containing histidine kinase [Bdellovibrionaceae bacterium]|nr:HAMP domain-containing histidine kinase [Bdellovibrio sp.]
MSTRWTVGFAGAVIMIGSIVLLGWSFDIVTLKSVVPGSITMKANTAMLLITMATVLILFRNETQTQAIRILGFFLCAFTAVISLLTLSEYLFSVNFSIDEFLFNDLDGTHGRFPPGRLAPITALSFIFLTLAFVLGNLPRRRFEYGSQFLIILVFFSAFQALIGYITGSTYVFGAAFYTQMALHTAVGFIFLTVGTIFSRSNRGFAKAFTSASTTAVIARKLLLAVILVPPLVRWIVQLGWQYQLYDKDFSTLLQLMGSTVLVAFVVLSSAKALYIFEQKVDQSLKQEMQARLLAEEAVRARDQFLSIASHELKTPVTSLSLQSQLINMQLEDAAHQKLFSIERLKTIFEMTERQVRGLLRLIEDMIDVSQINSNARILKIQTVNLGELVKQVVDEETTTFASAGVKLNYLKEDISVNCDQRLVAKVTGHLINNAFKYGRNKPVEVSVKAAPRFAEIRVSDQGLGIKTEDQLRIFNRFERAISANEISGLGLGLFISKNIIEAHGGSILVTSKLAEGSTFLVRLPI